MINKVITCFLMLIITISAINEAEAQRRGRKSRRSVDTERKENSVSFVDRLNPEIKLGNFFLGTQTSIDLKGNVGYKFNKTFSAGLGGKFYYDYINYIGPNDESLASFGGLAYGRALLSNSLYVQAEFNYTNFGSFDIFQEETLQYPAAGIGYIQRGDRWSFGAELLAMFDDRARDRIGLLEYWITFSYNLFPRAGE